MTAWAEPSVCANPRRAWLSRRCHQPRKGRTWLPSACAHGNLPAREAPVTWPVGKARRRNCASARLTTSLPDRAHGLRATTRRASYGAQKHSRPLSPRRVYDGNTLSDADGGVPWEPGGGGRGTQPGDPACVATSTRCLVRLPERDTAQAGLCVLRGAEEATHTLETTALPVLGRPFRAPLTLE